MFKRIRRLPCYFISLLIVLTCTLIFICTLKKADGFLLLNIYHTKFLDVLFRIITNLGDGILCIACGVSLFLFRKKKKATTLILAYCSSSILAQVAKRIFDLPRPRLLLEQMNIQYLNYVPGIDVHSHHSFPSGHTTSAFAMATVMVLVYKKRKLSLPCILLAILVGYSRIYLAQHFPIDVFFGIILGVFCALISYYQVYDLKLFRMLKAVRRLKRSQIQY